MVRMGQSGTLHGQTDGDLVGPVAGALTHHLAAALHQVALLARVHHANAERQGGGRLVASVLDVNQRLARDRLALRLRPRPLGALRARASGVAQQVVPFVALVRRFRLEGDVGGHHPPVGGVRKAAAADRLAHGVRPVPQSTLVAPSPHAAHQLVPRQAAAGDHAVQGEVRALDLTVGQLGRGAAVDGVAAGRLRVPVARLQTLDGVVASQDVAREALVDDAREEGVVLALHAGVSHEGRLAALHQHALRVPRLPLARGQAGQGSRGVGPLLVQRVAEVANVPAAGGWETVPLSTDRYSHSLVIVLIFMLVHLRILSLHSCIIKIKTHTRCPSLRFSKKKLKIIKITRGTEKRLFVLRQPFHLSGRYKRKCCCF